MLITLVVGRTKSFVVAKNVENIFAEIGCVARCRAPEGGFGDFRRDLFCDGGVVGRLVYLAVFEFLPQDIVAPLLGFRIAVCCPVFFIARLV
ncbi:hypothetical protein APU90_06970 [Rathayibacter toxicus]|nr:hypothetical protein APU90_06970 [Rathayibacter toxicus]